MRLLLDTHVVLWAIKQSIGKLVLALPAEEWLPDVLRTSGFDVVAVTLEAALRVRALPWHHRDPFDRLLIAQAFESDSTVVTRDAVFASYGVAVLDA